MQSRDWRRRESHERRHPHPGTGAVRRVAQGPEFVREYEALEEEFALASAVIGARAHAGLTQEELAERLGTSQSAIARLESGRSRPSATTLAKLAAATGTKCG
ncbi:helix-turn-helix domain-containing protein [Altererythrobacter soli]|uniref:Helix-turn-helix domain-containing protein n=1 Tax=Croceibacterium soli TaxID=1739690 RepID=A0A6I4USU3_9SPHN|nr:helix-turn-helix domain-containing protein [Croceibacterium soli]